LHGDVLNITVGPNSGQGPVAIHLVDNLSAELNRDEALICNFEDSWESDLSNEEGSIKILLFGPAPLFDIVLLIVKFVDEVTPFIIIIKLGFYLETF